MSNSKTGVKVIAIVCFLTFIPLISIAETWRLEQGQQWEPVREAFGDELHLKLSNIKEQLNKGNVEEVRQQWVDIKRDFPEMIGNDLEAFIDAEVLFAQGKFVKAARRYDDFLSKFPESGLYWVALDREFAIANAFLSGRKIRFLKLFKIRGYSKGREIMNKIIDLAGDAPLAKKAAVAVAESYESRKKFGQAYQRWSEIHSKWPTGEVGQKALLAMGHCYYNAYNGPKYDASDLSTAKSYYRRFINRYPKKAQEIGLPEKINNIDELLAEKRYKTAAFYEKTGNIQAANLYYQLIIDELPKTTAAKLAKQKIKTVE